MGSDLIDKMVENGIVANIQPSFVGTDAKWVQDRLEKKVQATSYVWKTLLKKGIQCAGGSDAPVEDCDPLIGLYDAITRLPHSFKAKSSPSPSSSDVFLPNERLTFSEALWLYTIGAAYACHSERDLGRIEAGFLADLVVFDRDVSQNPDQLLECNVEEVWVHGIQRLRKKATEEDDGDQQQVMLGGNYVPGKNSDIKAIMKRRGIEGAILPGKRLVGCCGH